MIKTFFSAYKIKIAKKHQIIGAVSLLYCLLSFYWEKFVFYAGAAENRPVTHILI